MPFAHRPDLCPPIDAYPGREPVELVVCEAVFRYQLQQSLVDHPQAPRYYLALQGHDANEALLRRLRELTPWVLPLSQCRVMARDGVTDRTTGARGVIVHVARLTWLYEGPRPWSGATTSPTATPLGLATALNIMDTTGP